MQKVITSLTDRLGNNLFQLANLIAYGNRHNLKICIPEWKFKPYFNISNQYFENAKLIFQGETFYNYQEKSFHYEPISEHTANVTLSGYFQSEKYFEDFATEIKKDFSFSYQVERYADEYYSHILTLPVTENCILTSVHWRMGDYINLQDFHPVMPVEYYIKAIKNICQKFPENKKVFLWFSDNINDVIEIINKSELKEFAKNENVEFKYIFNNPDYVDLFLQSFCHNQIIGNSTFSWWSAWLNNNKNKVILCPDKTKWFGSKLQMHNTKDLYPAKWEEIQW